MSEVAVGRAASGRRGGIVVAAWLAVALTAAAEEMQYPLSVAAGADGRLVVADRTLPGLWSVADGAGTTVGSVQARLANGATLLRITGESSGDVQERLYRWLSRPVVEAQFDGKITASESVALRDDIARSVDRLMRQPGGSDGKVAVSPRRN